MQCYKLDKSLIDCVWVIYNCGCYYQLLGNKRKSGTGYRLVGTTIVVVAAIVFIPNILDGEKVHHAENFKAIPDRPEFTTIDLQQAIDNKVASAEQPSEVAVEDVKANDAELTATEQQSFSDAPKMIEASTDEPVINKAEPKVAVQEPVLVIYSEPTRKPEKTSPKWRMFGQFFSCT